MIKQLSLGFQLCNQFRSLMLLGEKLAIDIVGPLDNGQMDCRYAITLIDYFSKWPEVAFTSQVTSATVIKFLTTVFSREGNPRELISDKGCQFVLTEFETFLQERNMKHYRRSTYYPQANGEIVLRIWKFTALNIQVL